MFDQVLDEVFMIAVIFILIPSIIIAAVLLINGRRKNSRHVDPPSEYGFTAAAPPTPAAFEDPAKRPNQR